MKTSAIKKDEANALKAVGDMQGRREKQSQINRLQAKYDDLSNKTGLQTNHERMEVKGFSKVKATTEKTSAVKNKGLKKTNNKDHIDFMQSNDDEFRYEIPDIGAITFKAPKVSDSKYPIYADRSVEKETIKFYENKIEQAIKDLPEDFVMPKRIILASMGENTAGGYMQSTDNLFLNSLLDTDEKISAFVNEIPGYFANTSPNGPLLHELGHKYHYTLVENLAKSKNIEYNKAKEMFDKQIIDFIDSNDIDIKNLLSRYAFDKYHSKNPVNEIMAEYFSVLKSNEKSNVLIDSIRKQIEKEVGMLIKPTRRDLKKSDLLSDFIKEGHRIDEWPYAELHNNPTEKSKQAYKEWFAMMLEDKDKKTHPFV